MSGRGAHVYTAHRGWLGVVTGIGAASTGGILVTLHALLMVGAVIRLHCVVSAGTACSNKSGRELLTAELLIFLASVTAVVYAVAEVMNRNTLGAVRAPHFIVIRTRIGVFCTHTTRQGLNKCSAVDGRPFGHNRHGPKVGGAAVPPFWGGELGSNVAHCRLHRGLPPYQVAS